MTLSPISRLAALLASLAVTFVVVGTLADYGLPAPAAVAVAAAPVAVGGTR